MGYVPRSLYRIYYMNFIQNAKHIFFHEWYLHWSPDIALRYLPIINDLKKSPVGTILDVGSGSLGITPYFKRNVTGVDVTFSPPYSKLLQRVKGTATKLPFKNQSFDYVLCVDTLEHVPPKFRPQVIKELLRVAKVKVYLINPLDEPARVEDAFINEYLIKHKGIGDPYLDEHIKYGQPKSKDIVAMIGSKYQITILPFTNIYLHRLLLIFQFSDHKVGRFISSVIFVLLTNVFVHINVGPTYRKLFILTKLTS